MHVVCMRAGVVLCTSTRSHMHHQHGTLVHVVGTMVLSYTCTNLTLSQTRLEIQALRCNGDTSGRCQHRRHHGILQYHGTTRVPWYHGTLSTFGTRVRTIYGTRVPWYHSGTRYSQLTVHGNQRTFTTDAKNIGTCVPFSNQKVVT